MNTNGAVTESYDYYPFGLKMPGRIYPATPTMTKNLFTGKERDSETNWDYFGARYYHSALGRWLAVDPLTEKYPSHALHSLHALFQTTARYEYLFWDMAYKEEKWLPRLY